MSLTPVYIRQNVRLPVGTATSFILETLAGSNLPLLFPSLSVANVSVLGITIALAIERAHVLAQQADAGFNGTWYQDLVPPSTINPGGSLFVASAGLDTSLVGSSSTGISTELQLSAAGPSGDALIVVELRGFINASIDPAGSVVIAVNPLP